MLLRVVLISLLGLGVDVAHADDKAIVNYLPAITASRDALLALMRKEGIEGASVAVTDEHGLVWVDGYGYADTKKKIPATGDTVYGAGAISMLLTALAVLRETDEQRLQLDAPVTHYAPEFSVQQRATHAKPITLRQLLSHHSGLPYGVYKGMWAKTPGTLEQAMAQLKNEYAAYAPETLMTFAMTNYMVAGRVLEKITQQHFAQILQQQVLQPLGMKNSGFQLTPALQNKLAQGYKNGKVQPLWQARDAPALGLFTTAQDIAALLRMTLNEGRSGGKAVWSSEAIKEFIRPQYSHIDLDFDARYALGWNLGDNEIGGVGRVAWRHGATLTHRGRVILLPDMRLGVVVFGNSAKAYKFTDKTAAAIARRFAEAKLGTALPSAPPGAAALTAPVTSMRMRSGPYATRVGYVSMSAENGRLVGDVMGWKFQLQPRADGWFYPKLRLFGFVPVDLELLEAMKITWQRVGERELIVSQYKGQNSVFAERLTTPTLAPAWAARVGRYIIDNPDEITEFMEVSGGDLVYDQGILYLAYKLPLWLPVTMRIPLLTLNDQEAIIPGLGTGLGETVRVIQTPLGERIQYSGYMIRRVK
ncbi:MAG: serine hydrolase domain-containing protein [Pseudomonadota bacterium]